MSSLTVLRGNKAKLEPRLSQAHAHCRGWQQWRISMSKRPAWYGGNKIPESYLKKFMSSQGKEAAPDVSYELRLFLKNLGGVYD